MLGSLRWTTVLAIVLCTIGVRSNYSPPERLTGMNPCISKQSCHECIQISTCAWCFATNFTEKRCFLPNVNTNIRAACPEQYIWNPDNEFHMVRHEDLTKGGYSERGGGYAAGGGSSMSSYSNSSYSYKNSSYSSSSGSSSSSSSSRQEAVQMWPQEVNLKLRINEAYKMHFGYSQAKDYPVDLYYLMDLSKSMLEDKEKLSALGELLVESMSKITSNFRLGFGSFVDKVVMPYVNTVPQALLQPCPQCAPPYGYKHVMKLSTNTGQFAKLVKDAPVSGNLDAPEGGFDAIMQAIVCRQSIGWRDQARRLLVFSTDAGFHYAGDGKLGGIIRPNDGQCHLDETGLYTFSSLQDYPSISQINLAVKKHKINIIWAVTHENINIYKRLMSHVEGSFAGILANDSSNVVELIREQYEKISSSVEMKDTASSSIKIRYLSSCLDEGSAKPTERSKCDGLKVGTKVEFIAEIEVTSCPKNRSEWKQSFDIYPVGVGESLRVNLEMLCDCPCENGGVGYEERSSECRGVGTLKCGVCECDHQHFGKNCECSSHDNTVIDKGASCRANPDSMVECSGQGTCVCGVCECIQRNNNPNETISGTFCECDNFSCERNNKRLCSDHGTCICGKCSCNSDYTGSDCSCPTSTANCTAPGASIPCSGHGECHCGECKCHDNWTGLYCHKCMNCPLLCDKLAPCIECQVYKIGNYTEEECAKNCTEFTPILVPQVTIDVDEEEIECRVDNLDNCWYRFVYYYDKTNLSCLKVRTQAERECQPQYFFLGIILGVIAAIVITGLLLLLAWKMFVNIHDRREFARFEKERMMARWDTGENPIYKQATSTFKNPTYAGK